MPTPNNQIRRKGSFAPLSAHYYLDAAMSEVGEQAELLYVRALAFCAATLSDGFISTAQLARGPAVALKNVSRRTQRLIDVGLWEQVEGGFRVRSWLEWNKSREEILAVVEADRERKSKGGRGGPPRNPNGKTTPATNGHTPGFRPESERNPAGIRAESGSTRARLSTSTSTYTSTYKEPGGDMGGGGPDSTRASTTPRPRCKRHAELPDDDPGPPCIPCRDARLAQGDTAITADALERTRRAEAAAIRDACDECDPSGWQLADDGTPVEPARRCNHGRPLRAVS